ncbi:DUF2505 domain-containing protein [Cellulomonas edaphi]|uniref:DUF2505 domain-containing protein n=1 Tax=Cellulomonas edaphi TaxID=3053468 RepID=A0ABT7S841_9CELL|nr:DUF2505 domain-containing protein [Cellulomons edaphi]MDM7831788.1 DUF2505 domain-containing protein [Cellulomons edaphi]
MRLTLSLELATDAHGAARLLADPDFVRETVRAAGATDEQVDVTGEPPQGPFTVTSRRALPADQIPAHVRGFVGNRIDVRQVDAWEAPTPDGSRAGTVVVEIAGAPVRLTGDATIAPAGPAASTVTYDGELKAAIPLFGSAVEQAAAGAIRSALEVIADVARRRLAAAPADEA